MDREQIEQWARLFHDTYERLAPEHGYVTRLETRVFDPRSQNGRLMLAVVGEVASLIRNAALEEAKEICEAGMDGTSKPYSDGCWMCAKQIEFLIDALAAKEPRNGS